MKKFITFMAVLLLTFSTSLAYGNEFVVEHENTSIYHSEDSNEITIKAIVDCGTSADGENNLVIWSDSKLISVLGKGMIFNRETGMGILTARVTISSSETPSEELFYLNFKMNDDIYKIGLKVLGSDLIVSN